MRVKQVSSVTGVLLKAETNSEFNILKSDNLVIVDMRQ